MTAGHVEHNKEVTSFCLVFSLSAVCSWIRVARSVVFCVVFLDHCLYFFCWQFYCLSFFTILTSN